MKPNLFLYAQSLEFKQLYLTDPRMYVARERKKRVSFLSYLATRGETGGRFLPYCDSGTVSLISEPSPMALPLSASSCTKGRSKKLCIYLLLKNNGLKSVPVSLMYIL